MTITILDIAKARGVKADDETGGINAGEFERVGLPFFAGCQCCEASLAPYNAHPSKSGFIRCRDCVGRFGFDSVRDFEAWEAWAADPDDNPPPEPHQPQGGTTMDRLELTAAQMRTIMKALYDSEDDDAAELHDAIAGLFARDEHMEGGENAAEIIIRTPKT